ncbi:hypothetical protein [Cognatiluteimonas weifangensis]|uniref:Uncharacterized protein n=1 Tax=Cognatiluteimonas weifangensis TaxID=2303539 RepID=A0A372DJR5_9GAMM|nr:hypothetical protein [Luteimonas weifangensis]RFP59831.1 hypothetical protein D0Y53_10000 [Luteimonas weifangensis]
MDDMKINVKMITGSVEMKTWFEADMQPSGDWLLSGNSCAIHRRADGSIRDVKFHKTGCNMTIPMGYSPPSFFDRLFNRKRSNT